MTKKTAKSKDVKPKNAKSSTVKKPKTSKPAKPTLAKKPAKPKAAPKPKKPAKSKTGKPKKPKEDPLGDMGIVIVEDDLDIDREKINEERRAYLEEARSQDASD